MACQLQQCWQLGVEEGRESKVLLHVCGQNQLNDQPPEGLPGLSWRVHKRVHVVGAHEPPCSSHMVVLHGGAVIVAQCELVS